MTRRNPEDSPSARDGAPRLLQISNWWAALSILVALAGSLAVAVQLLSRFSPWDDEGYMLVSLGHYISDGHLYTRTYSEYGPFYFYAQGFFFQLLHLPVNHNMGRLVTLLYWAASGALAAVFVRRISKSVFLSCSAGLCAVIVGRVLTNEPGHPQQVVLLLLMTAACLSLPWRSGRSTLRYFLLGCVGAALAFTKVNIGVFYIAALAQALFCMMPSGKIRSAGIGLALAYAAASPWLLMHARFDRGFREYFVLATIASITTVVCGALIGPQNRIPLRRVFSCGAGLAAGAALMIGATQLQGMSLVTLATGVLLNPLRHPYVKHAPLGVTAIHLWTAVLAAGVVIGLRASRRRMAESHWPDALVGVVGLVSIVLLTNYEIQWVAALLPLTLIRRPHWEVDAEALFARLFITCLGATQFLEAFPVAGSQTGIAAAPMLLWAFLCVSDGIAGLRASSRRTTEAPERGRRLDAMVGGALVVVYASISLVFSGFNRLPPSSSGLNGASWLHLPVKQAKQFEAISREVGGNCDMLFTAPGMGSFNVWSGVPTPNGFHVGAWMADFSLARQAEILDLMKADRQSCAILNSSLVGFWDGVSAETTALPLLRFISSDMPRAGRFGDYEIRVNPDRVTPWR